MNKEERLFGSDMTKSVFFLSVTPLRLVARAIDLSSEEIEQLILYPPENRQSGWNMDFPRRTVERSAKSITRGDEDYCTLTLLSNGYMELVVSVAGAFFWPQSEEEIRKTPRFNPYAVCEFPVTFLRLYREIAEKSNLAGPFLVNLAYKDIKGVTLRPGHPRSIGYASPLTEASPFSAVDLILEALEIEKLDEPDKTAYKLISEIYRVFGHRPESIPFYDDETCEFKF